MNNIKIPRAPYESSAWNEMSSMSFEEIMRYSNMFTKWSLWEEVNKEYGNSILKPINMYVHHFGIKPEIKKISENKITLIYKNYSDILIQIVDPPMGEKGIFKPNPIRTLFYATDKCWQRQFYPSLNTYNINTESFMSDRVFKFYIPWVLDIDVDYKIKQTENGNSVSIIENTDKFVKNINKPINEANYVDFYFTNFKDNMVTQTCGVIERGSNLYEIEVELTKEDMERLFNG
jgi:hypothetical protein